MSKEAVYLSCREREGRSERQVPLTIGPDISSLGDLETRAHFVLAGIEERRFSIHRRTEAADNSV